MSRFVRTIGLAAFGLSLIFVGPREASAQSSISASACANAVYPPFFPVIPAPPDLCAPIGSIGTTTGIVGNAFANQMFDIMNLAADNHVMRTAGFANGAIAVLPGVFPSGRLARTEHDGPTGKVNPRFKMTGYEMNEASGYVNLTFGMKPTPDSVLRIAPFIGGATVDVDYDNINLNIVAGGGFNFAYSGRLGEAENDSLMGGVNVTYAVGKTYGVLLVAYASGETDYEIQSVNQVGKYDTEGYAITAVLGHTYTLSGNRFLDVRGGLAYTDYEGDSHLTRATAVTATDVQIGESRYERFSGAFNLMLFTVMTSGDTITRPYIKTGVKHEFDETNTLDIPQQLTFSKGGLVSFDDDDTYWNVETGLHVNFSKNWDFVGAGYYEGTGDEDIVGGRLAVQYKFD